MTSAKCCPSHQLFIHIVKIHSCLSGKYILVDRLQYFITMLKVLVVDNSFSNHTNKLTNASPFSFFLPLLFSVRTLHQQFESYKEQVRKIGAETKRQQAVHKDDAPTCGICRKTKFADGCGHLCSYCQTKFCARCGGRVSLRSNNVRTHWETSIAFFSHSSI